MADIKDWESLGKPDPEWVESCKAVGGAPDLGMFPDIPSMVKFFTAQKQAASDDVGVIPGVKETDHKVKMRDGIEITIRVHAPESPPAGGSPLYVMYHGGGWCVGDLISEQLLCRLLASKLGVTVANVDYRLGPDWQFPTAHNDVYDATRWAAANAAELGADPSKGFLIGGTSAGGNMTCTVSHLWRDDECSPPLTGTHLMIPTVVNKSFYPEEYKPYLNSVAAMPNADILSKKAQDLFADNYIPEMRDRGDPLFSPLLFPTGHKNLPPAYFQIAGADPLRDEGLLYEKILREDCGIKTKIDVYPGQPHGFNSIFPKMTQAKKYVEDSVKGVEWLLSQS